MNHPRARISGADRRIWPAQRTGWIGVRNPVSLSPGVDPSVARKRLREFGFHVMRSLRGCYELAERPASCHPEGAQRVTFCGTDDCARPKDLPSDGLNAATKLRNRPVAPVRPASPLRPGSSKPGEDPSVARKRLRIIRFSAALPQDDDRAGFREVHHRLSRRRRAIPACAPPARTVRIARSRRLH